MHEGLWYYYVVFLTNQEYCNLYFAFAGNNYALRQGPLVFF